MRFSLTRELPADVPVLAVPVYAGGTVPDGSPVELDAAFLAASGFEGKVGQAQLLPVDDGSAVVATGVGERGQVSAETLRRAAAAAIGAAFRADRLATTLLDVAGDSQVDIAHAAQALAEGFALGAYRFTTYKSSADGCRVQEVVVVGRGGARSQTGLDRGARLAEATALARDLVNEPAGSVTPRRLAEVATEIAEREGLGIEVLDEEAIDREGLGGLAGVARGAAEPPRLIRLTYEPQSPRGSVALVGKGITFDSGGLSIKTAEGMETMKTDMSGAAAVIAALSVLPALGARARVVGIVPATENMPGGAAIHPGDVLRIRNGKTVEVLNTDAEGRLVLADGLSLAAELRPDAMVDIATLTGAQVVALGPRIAGLMGNNDDLIAQLEAASERSGEPVWHLPLPDEYRSHIDSEVADIKNQGRKGQAGTLVAGLFLREFADGRPWAHLDVAGPSRSAEDEAYLRKGATGFGVRTLVEFVTHFRRPRRG